MAEANEAEVRWAALVDRLPGVVVFLCDLDEDYTIRWISPTIEKLTGYSAEEFKADAQLWYRIIHPDDLGAMRAAERQGLIDDVGLDCEYRMIHRDGHVIHVWERDGFIHDEHGRQLYAQGALLDVTPLRQAEEQVAFLAYHDALTGLANRRLLHDDLELAIARARRDGRVVALLFLDLDDFKLVNDDLGHAAGDELLAEVARRIAGEVRGSDMVARQGGDEFLVLLPDITGDPEEAARDAAARIAFAVREPFRIAGTEVSIGVSIGVSFFPTDAEDAATLLMHADRAMYDAKSAGTGQVRVYQPAERAPSGLERLSIGRRLRRAIDDDELRLHWQPIYALDTGNVFGLEALVRWQDPLHGLRDDEELLPAIARSGLADAVDDWVIDAFSRQRLAWRSLGLDPHVGLNLAPSRLSPERLPAILAGLRVGGGLERVTIELVEDLARDPESLHAALGGLTGAGVTIALDDFGVGYSSLSRLAELPVQWIKIDRSFLHGVPHDPAAVRLLDSIVELVRALGVHVIVEGVSTAAQLAHLTGLGVELAQGDHLCRPLPGEEVTALLSAEAGDRHLVPRPRRGPAIAAPGPTD